jgi:hypothetical protein
MRAYQLSKQFRRKKDLIRDNAAILYRGQKPPDLSPRFGQANFRSNCDFVFRFQSKMTSPAINGQKENSKTDSNVTLAQPPQQTSESTSTSIFVAWWRVFKLANLMIKQGC